MGGKRKASLKLFGLFHHGACGWMHSSDYPKCWTIRAAAERYRREIPLPKRLNYRIVEFREVGHER